LTFKDSRLLLPYYLLIIITCINNTVILKHKHLQNELKY
jgi:hypothetical protein